MGNNYVKIDNYLLDSNKIYRDIINRVSKSPNKTIRINIYDLTKCRMVDSLHILYNDESVRINCFGFDYEIENSYNGHGLNLNFTEDFKI